MTISLLRIVMMTRGYVTPGEAGLIVFLVGSVIGTALITSVFLADYYCSKKADVQHIDREHNMCEIRVTRPCGDDICRYKASIPCAEVDALIKTSKGK